MNCLCPLFSNEIFNGVVSKESHLYTMVFKNTGNGSYFFACRSKLSPFLFDLSVLVAFLQHNIQLHYYLRFCSWRLLLWEHVANNRSFGSVEDEAGNRVTPWFRLTRLELEPRREKCWRNMDPIREHWLQGPIRWEDNHKMDLRTVGYVNFIKMALICIQWLCCTFSFCYQRFS